MVWLKNRVKRSTRSQQYVVELYPPPSHTWELNLYEYRYHLTGYPIQYDPVIRFLKNAIRQVAKQNMYVCAVSYKIEALTHQLPIWPLSKSNAQCWSKTYAIKKCFDEFPYSISVSIKHRSDSRPLTMDRVMVRINKDDKPKPFDKFLLDLAVGYPYGHPRGNPGLSDQQMQQKWWRMNGMSFRLLDLPAELRSKIYLHALGSVIRPHIFPWNLHSGRVVLGSLSSNPDWEERVRWAAEKLGFHFLMVKDTKKYTIAQGFQGLGYPNYNILRVSKQVHREAMMAGWTGTEKVFHSADTLNSVLRCPRRPMAVSPLANITLSLDLQQYFVLFGWTVDPQLHRSHDPQDAPGRFFLEPQVSPIKKFSLVFPDPYDYTLDNPWKTLMDRASRLLELDQYQEVFQPFQVSPCYRHVVDWILIFAYPFLKNIPSISFRGCIKAETKTKWEHIFRTEYASSQGKDTYGGHGFIYEDAVADLVDRMRENRMQVDLDPHPAWGAPACECPKSCATPPVAPEVPVGKRVKDYHLRQQLLCGFDHNDTFRMSAFDDTLEDEDEDAFARYSSWGISSAQKSAASSIGITSPTGQDVPEAE